MSRNLSIEATAGRQWYSESALEDFAIYACPKCDSPLHLQRVCSKVPLQVVGLACGQTANGLGGGRAGQLRERCAPARGQANDGPRNPIRHVVNNTTSWRVYQEINKILAHIDRPRPPQPDTQTAQQWPARCLLGKTRQPLARHLAPAQRVQR